MRNPYTVNRRGELEEPLRSSGGWCWMECDPCVEERHRACVGEVEFKDGGMFTCSCTCRDWIDASPLPRWVRMLFVAAFIAVFVLGLVAAFAPVMRQVAGAP